MPVLTGRPVCRTEGWWHQELAAWCRWQASGWGRWRRDLQTLQIELGPRAYWLLREENRRR